MGSGARHPVNNFIHIFHAVPTGVDDDFQQLAHNLSTLGCEQGKILSPRPGRAM